MKPFKEIQNFVTKSDPILLPVELYFMTHVHKGPQSELKKAFDSLDQKKRDKYEKIVDRNRREFMETLQNYVSSVQDEEQAKFKDKVQRVLKEQNEKIGWSKVKESSDEDSSSDSTSSDEDSD